MAKLPVWAKDDEAIVGASSLVIKRRRISNFEKDKMADDGGLEALAMEGSTTFEW